MRHPAAERLSATGFLLVCLMTWALPMLTDAVMPALPALRAQFGASLPAVQGGMLSLALAVFAVMQTLMGLLADRYGRRPVLLGGITLYLAGSLLALQAESFTMVLACRLLQAAGAAAGPVLGRAIIRDVLPPAAVARAYSVLGLGIALVPLLMPTVAGWLVAAHGWRGVFMLYVGYALLLLALVVMRLPETLTTPDRAALQPARIAAALREVLGRPVRVAALGALVGAYAGLLVFLSSGPFVLLDHFGVPAAQLGSWLSIALAGFLGGSLCSTVLSRRMAPARVLRAGTVLLLAGAVLQAALAAQPGVGGGPLGFLLPMAVYTFGWGLVQPQAQALTLAIDPHLVGRGSALLGLAQLTGAGVVVWALSHVQDGGPLRPALALCGCALLAWAAATAGLVLSRRDGGRGPSAAGTAGHRPRP